MYDVVPPSNGGRFNSERKQPRPARRITRGKARRMPKAEAGPKPPVVQFEWKLPARLRRPVRYELERQRRKQRQKQAIIQFEKRPLYSELPSKYPLYSTRRTPKPSRGAEQHTGDVWREKKPGASVMMPPYAGGFAQARVSPVKPKVNMPARGTRRQVPVKKQVQVPITGERDVPYEWTKEQKRVTEVKAPATEAKHEVKPPAAGWRSRFALPLHFSIFPKNIVPAKAGQEVESPEVLKEAWRKKKLYRD